MEASNIFALVLGVAFVALIVWKFIGMNNPIPPATDSPKPTAGGPGITGGSGGATTTYARGAKSKTVRNKK